MGYCCSNPYVSVGTQCLFFPTLDFDYVSSAEVCDQLNGRLVKIDDTQKLYDIVQHIKNDTSKNHSYWVSGNDMGGHWAYDDGIDIPLGTPYWATYIDQQQNYQQHPVMTNTSADNCLAIRSDTSFFFTSNDCLDKNSPLCEEITGTTVRNVRTDEYHYTAPTGSFHSLNYPNDYPNGYDSVYTITVEEGTVITLIAVAFDLENCSGGSCDYVSIRDGGTGSSPELAKLFGSINDFQVTSTSNKLYISFHTDGIIVYSGFSFVWTSGEWDGTWDGDCTLDYNTATGSFYSPLYPNHYPINLDCHWAINIQEGSAITLTLLTFDTEANTDIVHIRDGASSSSPLLSTLSGHVETGYAVTSSSNHLYITFSTDSSNIGPPGFSFVWNSQELCPTPYLNVGQMCLHFSLNSLSYGMSGLACEEEGGVLASINDPRDLRDLYTYLQTKGIGDTSFWIGGSDLDEEGLWKWKGGSLVPTGTPFWGTTGYYSEIQEPNGGDAENCLILLSDGFHYFRDEPCDTQAPAICMHLPQ